MANATHVHEKHEPTEKETSYRPISILHLLSKKFERLIYE